MLAENVKEVQKNIEDACKRAGRKPKDVELIAVSKTKPVEQLLEVYDTGIRAFGENYVQELTEKIEVLPKDIRWHMIGHLQRNKVKYIVGKVALIHSVDSLRLAEEISKEAVKKNICADILLEVNVAQEENKFGFTLENMMEEIGKIAVLPNIHIKGLMTSAPFVENPEENREYFRQLKQLSVDINGKNIDNVCMDILSMGMSSDYYEAILEGANMVRIGSALFGNRIYK